MYTMIYLVWGRVYTSTKNDASGWQTVQAPGPGRRKRPHPTQHHTRPYAGGNAI